MDLDALDRLPSPAGRRVAVRVTREAARQLRAGHPWLFASSVRSVSHDGEPGDLAVVFDPDRELVAVGLYDPASMLRVRVLHHGSPRTVDVAFWHEHAVAALARRSGVVGPGTDGFRAVHGESDGFGGLVADVYAGTLVLKVYSDAWTVRLASVVPALVDAVASATSHPVERVVVRCSRDLAARPHSRFALAGLRDGVALAGALPDGPVLFHENGLVFEADVVHGQKTGHFLDQRDNRARVRDLVRDRIRRDGRAEVLDVFCCTGGFSVYAAAGGATSVHSVDLAPGAIATTRRNMAHNRDRREVAACRHHTTTGDAFTVLADLADRGARFDVVVIDPPSFASKQADVARACRAYARLTRLGLAVVGPDGVLVQSSCSSRVGADLFAETVLDAAASSGRRVRELDRTGHAADHPVGFAEAAYLDTLFLAVR